ncbi:MAG: CHC2 zinc finger domain-containing protein, partial [Ginsengibacter sp.]
YLKSISYQPQRTGEDEYWFLSLLRDEKHPSFKVQKSKNIWYDYSTGKGESLIDFVKKMHQCDLTKAVQKLLSFHPQKIVKNNPERPLFYLHENSITPHENARETWIRIIAANQPIEDHLFCRYLRQRNISKNIAHKCFYGVHFIADEKEKIQQALGFKNNTSGYELRNEYFEVSSAQKYVSYIDNKANNISVFEGFFDLLSYQFIHQNQDNTLTILPFQQRFSDVQLTFVLCK